MSKIPVLLRMTSVLTVSLAHLGIPSISSSNSFIYSSPYYAARKTTFLTCLAFFFIRSFWHIFKPSEVNIVIQDEHINEIFELQDFSDTGLPEHALFCADPGEAVHLVLHIELR